MRRKLQPATYLSVGELEQLAATKFEEASQLPEGPQRQEILKSAFGFRSVAEMKRWLSSELRPPK